MISPLWDTVILAIGGFLLGSVPFGYLIARLNGVDIRKVGSGNIGATNAIRALGTRWGIVIGLLDALKGAVPALLAVLFIPYPGIVGAAAILGHIFSPWLGFKGGKGVATTLGTFALLSPVATLGVSILWAVLFWSTGYVSVASVFALAGLPVAILLVAGFRPEISVICAAAGVALVVAWAHRGNMMRLLAGKENRADFWKRMYQR